MANILNDQNMATWQFLEEIHEDCRADLGSDALEKSAPQTIVGEHGDWKIALTQDELGRLASAELTRLESEYYRFDLDIDETTLAASGVRSSPEIQGAMLHIGSIVAQHSTDWKPVTAPII